MRLCDYIADCLSSSGCDVVFGYQGSSIANIIDAISRHTETRFVESRNEQGAAFAANGYAMAKGDIGVAVACSGPGALNLVTGIANAYYDSVPCLFITGQVSESELKPNGDLRQYGFQETEIVEIVRPIVKYAKRITDPLDIIFELPKAIGIALEGRQGPVLLDIPHNVQKAVIEFSEHDVSPFTSTTDDGSSVNEISSAAYKLLCAKRPVVLLGGGCSNVPPQIVASLNDRKIPVVTSYRGKGLYDNHASNYCGTIGVFGNRSANLAVKYSDLLLCFGTRLDGRQTAYEPMQVQVDQNIVVFDIDDAELEKHPNEYDLVKCDANKALRNIADSLGEECCFGEWLEAINGWENRFPSDKFYTIRELVNPNLFLRGLDAIIDNDANIVLDVGQNQLWSNVSLSVGCDQCLLQSAGLGSMGFSLPAAIGAYFANGHQTICISGDGGFQMNVQELQLLSEYDIPLKIFVLNNNSLGLIRDYQHKALGDRYAGSIEGFGSPDYSLLAKAYDVDYLKVSTGIEEGIKGALKDDKAWLIEVEISQKSTSCPEPTYGKSIINQSPPITDDELEAIKEEAYGQR